MDLVLIILTSISADFEKHKQYETHSLHLFQLEIVSTAYISLLLGDLHGMGNAN